MTNLTYFIRFAFFLICTAAFAQQAPTASIRYSRQPKAVLTAVLGNGKLSTIAIWEADVEALPTNSAPITVDPGAVKFAAASTISVSDYALTLAVANHLKTAGGLYRFLAAGEKVTSIGSAVIPVAQAVGAIKAGPWVSIVAGALGFAMPLFLQDKQSVGAVNLPGNWIQTGQAPIQLQPGATQTFLFLGEYSAKGPTHFESTISGPMPIATLRSMLKGKDLFETDFKVAE